MKDEASNKLSIVEANTNGNGIASISVPISLHISPYSNIEYKLSANL